MSTPQIKAVRVHQYGGPEQLKGPEASQLVNATPVAAEPLACSGGFYAERIAFFSQEHGVLPMTFVMLKLEDISLPQHPLHLYTLQ